MTSSFCDPCMVLHKHNNAINSCLECDESLCSVCSDHHKSLKATRNHILIDIDLQPTFLSLTKELSASNCKFHPLRDIQYFCVNHDLLCCGDCLAADHSKCEQVLSVELASVNAKESVSFRECQNELNHILKSFSGILESGEKTEIKVLEDLQIVRKKISDTKWDVVKQATDIENDMLLKVTTIEKSILKRLKTTATEAAKEKEIVGSHLNEIHFIKKNGSDKEAFLLSKHLSTYTNNCDSKLKNIVSNLKDFSVKFEKTPDILSTIKQFGEITTEEYPRHVPIQLPKRDQAQVIADVNMGKDISSFNLSSSFDVKAFTTVINSIAVTSDDTILLMEHNLITSSKIVIYTSTGHMIGSVNIPSVPKDICIIPDTDKAIVSVCSWTRSCLLIINSKHIRLDKTVPLPVWDVKGVATTGEEIVLGSYNLIYVVNFEGELLKKHNVQADSIKHIHIDKQGDYFYIDSGILYCLRTDGKEKIVTKSDKFCSSSKFDIDDHGNIFYILKGSKRISKLPTSSSKQCIYTSVNKVHMLEPKFICFNTKCTKVFVANGIGHINVFNCT